MYFFEINKNFFLFVYIYCYKASNPMTNLRLSKNILCQLSRRQPEIKIYICIPNVSILCLPGLGKQLNYSKEGKYIW